MAKLAASTAELLAQASDPSTTPFDYIVVGSGAGGGTLAARLARSGKRVLVLEAGADVAIDRQEGGAVDPQADAAAKLREVYEVPVYYAAASEDPPMSWGFSMRHFADTAEQQQDPKYNPDHDPSQQGGVGKGGILYPRASGLGGCTNHHAMIIVKPNDLDWERVGDLTGDDSWRAAAMQGYFALIEQVLYYTAYQSAARKVLGKIAQLWRDIVAFLKPSDVLDNGGHGTAGWQKTSFISPALILAIAKTDLTFIRVLVGAIWWILKRDGNWKHFLKAIFSLQLVSFLDPNFRRDWKAAPDVNLKFIPIGTDGSRRTGLREWLLQNAGDYPDNLTIVTETLATRVIFEAGAAEEEGDVEPAGESARPPVPRAIGVEVADGSHLYEASPDSSSEQQSARAPRRQFFARREVVLSGGAFNTPQLMMLSGIGDQAELAAHGIDGLHDREGRKVAEGIHLPGVGKNLQDRYEVSVISEVKKPFSTLDGATFIPGDPNDPARLDWLKTGGGLYATNGGAIAFLARSGHHDGPEADLFVFGVPAAFRGYYWDWSKQLLSPVLVPPGQPVPEQRNIWSWVILKAYTHNGGTVRLRSASPFAEPEIDTDSFARDPATGFWTPGAEKDLAAVEAAVEMVRDINASISLIDREIQPGKALSNSQVAKWVHRSAWGHHANGTCRMGSDAWRPYASELKDKNAVLDSRFRVHGVRGLRIVDASIFPEIPGYFIVTPIFMAAEKAAETLIDDSTTYPESLEAAEAAAVRRRRQAALETPVMPADVPVEGGPVVAARLWGADAAAAKAGAGEVRAPWPEADRLPRRTVGLALSGGGIRSATFCLGVLQALATRGRLRGVDFLSTVSGGGYIGSFLGRLFTRVAPDVADKPAYVEKVLRNSNSAQVDWLRTHVNYLAGEGKSDLQTNLGTVWRNLVAVQLSVGTLFLAIFGLLRWISGPDPAGLSVLGLRLSPWYWVPVAIFVVFGIPFWFGYWLAPRKMTRGPYAVFAMLLWVVLLGGAVVALGIADLALVGAVAIVVLLLSWVALEVTRWNMPPGSTRETQGLIVRNRLTRALGTAVLVFVAALLWVVLDSLARAAADQSTMRPMIVGMWGVVMALLPFFRDTLTGLTRAKPSQPGATATGGSKLLLAVIAFGLLAFELFALDVVAHWSFDHSLVVGLWLALLAFTVSAVLGRDVSFLNLSSLQSTYAARLARTFLGASNPERIYPHGAGTPTEVQVPDADDDVEFERYHPELNGGPLHLIGVCVNETADIVSGRHLKQDKGLQMCVGPEGVSVGRRFHSLWVRSAASVATGASVVRALLARNDPNAFHVLKQRGRETSDVEPLRLSQWIATSGAAFSTGSGRNTRLALSLLLGLLNVRLGYWWDSRIRAGQRPGNYPPDFWRRLLEFPSYLFRTQRMLLDEWRGYFAGPSQRFWYLSDGGHFEGTGMYELIRRQLPFIVAVDALHDPRYLFNDVSTLIRLAEVDFGARFTWMDPAPARAAGWTGWAAFEDHDEKVPEWMRVPGWIQEWLDPEAIGSWQEIQRNGPFAATLARITYSKGRRRRPSWLLLLKSAVPPGMPLDVRSYAEGNPAFPNDPTADQFLTDEQWESYRALGQRTAECVLTRSQPLDSSGGQAPDARIGPA